MERNQFADDWARQFPSFTTERLHLRAPVENDREFLASLDTNSDVMRYIHEGPLSEKHAAEFADVIVSLAGTRRMFGRWLITLRDSNVRLGWIDFTRYRSRKFDDFQSDDLQLAYVLAPESWGHGYAAEAAQAILVYAFEDLNLERVLVYARPDNERSIKLIYRLGFELVSFCQDEIRKRCQLFKLTQSQWRESKGGKC